MTKQEVQIYPNPTVDGSFTVKVEAKSDYAILDIAGKVLSTSKLDIGENNKIM